MCTVVVSQRILNSLQARISNGDVFSAFDITTDARDGIDERVNHKDVRRIVTSEFETGQFPGSYNKEIIQLDIMDNPNVVVYYPDGKNASDHPKALNQSVAPIPIPVSSSPSKSDMGGKVKDGNEYVCKATAEGRVNIPMNILRQVGIQGGTYDVWFQGKAFYKKPNTDGRLRIAKSELGDGDKSKIGDKFRIRVISENNTILIEQE